ncbi:hypothetical protein L1987_25110 [Smallanthus sonchifolius]|uniref:Uncharacterized protein n=1 Tax=Smallanthus sonchifolius TaxID=185202 RepID=A0ACB9INR6_9ASTR|nr:hypothetical protein L1987_25110 [Smallanthus sonchifolius]
MMNWNTSSDCCNWNGVMCHQSTGDVIGLNLSNGMLQGTIHPNTSLLHLPHLEKLILAFNDFTASKFPNGFGRLSSSLTHLNIATCGFSSQIPTDITHLHKLVSLYLAWNAFDFNLGPHAFNNLFRNFTVLEELSLQGVVISSVLPTYLNISSSLKLLDLRNTGVQGKLPRSVLPTYLNLSSLKSLDLSNTSLVGKLPDNIFNLQHLEQLFLLGNNNLTGPLPEINVLDQGPILQTFRQLTNRTSLDLSYNNFRDDWELDTLLSSLTNLVSLDLSYSGLSVMTNGATRYVNPDFNTLCLASCKIKVFPKSLQAMKNLIFLNLSSNDIHGPIPDWAGEIGGSMLLTWDISNNYITGLPQFQWPTLHNLHLQSNLIQGPFPPSICNLSNLRYWDMSNNKFGGVIPQCVGNIFPSLIILDLGNNWFQGTVPNVFEDFIDLSYNNFQGEIPDIIGSFNNGLNDKIPDTLGNLSEIESLDLSCNQLTREIPQGLTDDGDEEGDSGFTWKAVLLGYGYGALLGLVIGYLMFSSRKPKCFDAIGDTAEHMILNKKDIRKHIYISQRR